MEQAEGRPGVASEQESQGITIVRTRVRHRLRSLRPPAPLDAGKLTELRAELLSSISVAPAPSP